MNFGLTPLAQESAPLRRKLAATLRRLVETGVLKAGQRVIEKDLCAELEVSRTVLREALRELESEGLLTAGPRGLFVMLLNRQEAENLYAVRASLEGLVAAQFCENADDADMALLKQAAERLEQSYNGEELDALLIAKRAFYTRLCAGARNTIVLDLLERLNSRTSQLRTLSLSVPARKIASIAEIRELVAALMRRDSIRARALAEAHVKNAGRVALRTMK